MSFLSKSKNAQAAVWRGTEKTSPQTAWKTEKEQSLFVAYPKIVSELQRKDGNALVVKRTSYWARDITGDYGDETGGQQPGSLIPQLSCQQEGGDGSQATEDGSQEHAHVTDVHGHMEQVQEIMD